MLATTDAPSIPMVLTPAPTPLSSHHMHYDVASMLPPSRDGTPVIIMTLRPLSRSGAVSGINGGGVDINVTIVHSPVVSSVANLTSITVMSAGGNSNIGQPQLQPLPMVDVEQNSKREKMKRSKFYHPFYVNQSPPTQTAHKASPYSTHPPSLFRTFDQRARHSERWNNSVPNFTIARDLR